MTRGHLHLPSVPCLVTSPLCSIPVISLFRSQLKHHLLRDPLSSPTCSVKYHPVCFPHWMSHSMLHHICAFVFMFISCLLGGWWTGEHHYPPALPPSHCISMLCTMPGTYQQLRGCFQPGELTEVSRLVLSVWRESLLVQLFCSNI